jgi:hypothetical protein
MVIFPMLTEAITGRELTEVTAPVIGETPVSAISPTEQYTGTIEWKRNNEDNMADPFSANVSYTAIITFAPNNGYLPDYRQSMFTVPGAETNTRIEGGEIIVTAVFPVLADNPATLDVAIAAAKGSARLEHEVQLTLDFYTKANNAGKFIIVDPGDEDNEIPYTIKGTGSADALNVGIVLANDNVTLEDVKINLTTTSTNAASFTPQTVYRTAISIGRAGSNTMWFYDDDLTSSNVTVKNCDVTVTGTNGSTAGIYICGATITDVYAPTNITLTGNIVKATGYSTKPVQALFIDIWHPSITITGNTFKATYSDRGQLPYYDPASAIYINSVFGEDKIGSKPPIISGNTLISSVYSFYFYAFKDDANIWDHTGVDVLRTDKFGVAETKWALTGSSDDDSTYKQLFNALKDDISGKGFACVSVPLDSAIAIEQYEIDNGEVTAISVYGDHIDSDAYDGDNNPNQFAGSGTDGYDYGRKLAGSDDYTNTTITGGNKFCYGLDATGNGYEYDDDLDPENL